MIIRKEIIIILMILALVIKVNSQTVMKTINNEVFISNIGSICEETSGPDSCAGQVIYLILKFNSRKVIITEMYVSSCNEKSISYELEYKWELSSINEINIFSKPEEVKYKSIENMKLKMIDGMILGYKADWQNKVIEYVFYETQ